MVVAEIFPITDSFWIRHRIYVPFDFRRLCVEYCAQAFRIFFHQFIKLVSFFIQCILPEQNAISYRQPFISVSNKINRGFR